MMFNGLLRATASGVVGGRRHPKERLHEARALNPQQVRPTRPDQQHVTRPSMSRPNHPASKSMRAMA
jgi:hypothetical protein